MAEAYLGQMIPFGGNFAIRSWAYCQAQLLNIAQNTALYSVLGTTYGGDGRVTFGLPDLRGRSAIGIGAASYGTSYSLGQAAGVPSVTLVGANLPPIPNLIPVSSKSAPSGTPNSAIPAASVNPNDLTTINTYAPPNAADGALATNYPGQGVQVNTMSPYLAVSWLICVEGLFPPRN